MSRWWPRASCSCSGQWRRAARGAAQCEGGRGGTQSGLTAGGRQGEAVRARGEQEEEQGEAVFRRRGECQWPEARLGLVSNSNGELGLRGTWSCSPLNHCIGWVGERGRVYALMLLCICMIGNVLYTRA